MSDEQLLKTSPCPLGLNETKPEAFSSDGGGEGWRSIRELSSCSCTVFEHKHIKTTWSFLLKSGQLNWWAPLEHLGLIDWLLIQHSGPLKECYIPKTISCSFTALSKRHIYIPLILTNRRAGLYIYYQLTPTYSLKLTPNNRKPLSFLLWTGCDEFHS